MNAEIVTTLSPPICIKTVKINFPNGLNALAKFATGVIPVIVTAEVETKKASVKLRAFGYP